MLAEFFNSEDHCWRIVPCTRNTAHDPQFVIFVTLCNKFLSHFLKTWKLRPETWDLESGTYDSRPEIQDPRLRTWNPGWRPRTKNQDPEPEICEKDFGIIFPTVWIFLAGMVSLAWKYSWKKIFFKVTIDYFIKI